MFHCLKFRLNFSSSYTHPLQGGLSAVVRGRLQVRAATTNKDFSLAWGHFTRADNCRIGSLNLVAPVEVSWLSWCSRFQTKMIKCNCLLLKRCQLKTFNLHQASFDFIYSKWGFYDVYLTLGMAIMLVSESYPGNITSHWAKLFVSGGN